MIRSWNEKVICHEDNFGYKVIPGPDDGEVTLYYFEKVEHGDIKLRRIDSFYAPMGALVAKAIIEVFEELEDGDS